MRFYFRNNDSASVATRAFSEMHPRKSFDHQYVGKLIKKNFMKTASGENKTTSIKDIDCLNTMNSHQSSNQFFQASMFQQIVYEKF